MLQKSLAFGTLANHPFSTLPRTLFKTQVFLEGFWLPFDSGQQAAPQIT
ncbi:MULTISPECIES: hypothetical protein [Pseudosulfitobacter]|nr:hypothetical protein [Pseudosulfitobacter pseudonitzschiae]QKS09077.1 hypothetical protein HT745_11655 [Pseudosulfitobacter pseudonitzschiae]